MCQSSCLFSPIALPSITAKWRAARISGLRADPFGQSGGRDRQQKLAYNFADFCATDGNLPLRMAASGVHLIHATVSSPFARSIAYSLRNAIAKIAIAKSLAPRSDAFAELTARHCAWLFSTIVRLRGGSRTETLSPGTG